jgi:hypothetical protein
MSSADTSSLPIALVREPMFGYEFFLDHFTIYGEETVLFAQPK